MSVTGSILALCALGANGLTEGHHWSGKSPLHNSTNKDLYHVCTGITLWGGIVACALGVTWLEALGLALFGVMGVRDWGECWMARGHPFALSEYPLTVWKWKTYLVRKRWFRIPIILTGVTCLLLEWFVI